MHMPGNGSLTLAYANAHVRLMAALGPGEQAQLAEMLKGDVYGGLAEAMAQMDPEELRRRFGDEVGHTQTFLPLWALCVV